MSMSFFTDELAEAMTDKRGFLEQMDRLVPWEKWVAMIEPHYYKGERGNKPYPLERMLRIYILQNLYNLADMAASYEVIDSHASARFCEVTSINQVPDGDTIGRFRHILTDNDLQEKIFADLEESLEKEGLILKKGTIVDSTLIAAPSSTKNKEKKRDEEAHQVKKGQNWHFGYKAHIGVDKDSGLAHHVVVTAANEHDVTVTPKLLNGTETEVYGDSGYLGAEKRDEAKTTNEEGEPIQYRINRRPSSIRKLPEEEQAKAKQEEHEKSSVRAKVEHQFAIIKRLFRHRKARYKGLANQIGVMYMQFTLSNLLQAHWRRQRLVCRA